MCGIAGMCNFKNNFLSSGDYEAKNINILKQMRTAIAHRGNDQTGEYLKGHIGLSHTRLSIRDISKGSQPMIRIKDNHEYAIAFNGEIYNTNELTQDLKSAGYSFETTCDTEVILYAYMHYGYECVKYLNGIFAFAIWDGAKQQLMLARDRVGVKPLFYTLNNDSLIFGSEIKALFAHPDVTPRVSINSFREIFGIGPARTPGCGVFDGINEIEPGFYALYDMNGLSFHKYWDIVICQHTDTYEQTVEKVRFLLSDAISMQMISDVPVCSFLSGGIDSSIVTAVAADFLSRSGARLNTYSFDFSGNDRYFKSNSFQPERDRPYVDIMLSHIDVNHTYLQCDESSLAELLEEATYAKDLPGMADIDASLLYFCKLVKVRNKVALTGECADEIFGGYPWFYREDLMEGNGFPWSRDINVRQCLLQDEFINKLDLKNYVNDIYEKSLSKMPVVAEDNPKELRRKEIAYLNIKWFMQTLLDRMDRASMFSGLEARVPFADHRIIEYVFNVPWDMKCRNGVEKSLLRHAFIDVLPKELIYRKKSPYPKTYNPNYEWILKNKLLSILDTPEDPVNSILDTEKVTKFLQSPAEYGKPWFGQLMAAPQLIAYIIQISQWLNLYKPEITI
ncbi:MAG: asparagine synthase (glutamine-hydrolyzing) [Clostridiales bacterium]|nr:MAG: asparagine synthase (glutamine-hydrolyzing) [Clostridiales bacterium]